MGGKIEPPWPRIGIVIPVFGHSRLVGEAIASALDQDYRGAIDVIVVVDGDKDQETLQTVASFLPAPDRSIAALYRSNGRLSAARNTGIRYLLQRFDDLFSIYFLDADNRLTVRAIRAFTQALLYDENAGWAYPDVTFFGLNWGYSGFDVRETAPIYSRFRHLMGNICEAGSMIRASLFRDGIRFDETFTHGYEDWEFWLQCLAKGHFGTRVEDSGFLYRRRADSMLADADRVSADIRARIAEKHGSLYRHDELWKIFAVEFRPLLFAPVAGDAVLLSTSEHAQPVSGGELGDLVARAYRRYHHTYLPRFVLYPLSPTAEAPHIDLLLLQRIMERRGERALYLGRDGSLATVRSDISVHGLIQFEDIALGRECPPELLQFPACHVIRQAVARMHGDPNLAHVSRRYSGPASYRIDDFLHDREAARATAPVSQLPARRRCLALHGMPESEANVVLRELRSVCQVTAANLDQLRHHPQASHHTAYNGAGVTYREDDALYKFVGDVASGFDTLYVVDDLSYLFHAGQWKAAAKEIVLLVTRPLTGDERIALQGVEHSLTRIVCSETEMVELAALGIPGRKLLTSERHFAELAAEAKAPRATVRSALGSIKVGH